MGNKGLTEGAIQLSGKIGDRVSYAINVNKEDSNLFLSIPILSTIRSDNSMNFELCYCLREKYTSKRYGKGVNYNFGNSILDYDTHLYLCRMDGYRERFEYVEKKFILCYNINNSKYFGNFRNFCPRDFV